MPSPTFPTRVKFAPLRRIIHETVDSCVCPTQSTCERPAAWDYRKTITLLDTAPLEDCVVFFLNPWQGGADELSAVLRLRGALPVAYQPFRPASPDGYDANSIVLAEQLLQALADKGYTHLEFSFNGLGVNRQDFAEKVIDMAHAKGLAVAVYGMVAVAEALKADALTVNEVRATRGGKFYGKFIGKSKRAVYSTEFGKPTAPGKEKIDLKAYAITHFMSLSLMAVHDCQKKPVIHYCVTY